MKIEQVLRFDKTFLKFHLFAHHLHSSVISSDLIIYVMYLPPLIIFTISSKPSLGVNRRY